MKTTGFRHEITVSQLLELKSKPLGQLVCMNFIRKKKKLQQEWLKAFNAFDWSYKH
jgi:hypothetical protein